MLRKRTSELQDTTPEKLESALATRVKELREEKGWSQRDLAEQSGVSTRTITNIETATARTRTHRKGPLVKLGIALGGEETAKAFLRIAKINPTDEVIATVRKSIEEQLNDGKSPTIDHVFSQLKESRELLKRWIQQNIRDPKLQQEAMQWSDKLFSDNASVLASQFGKWAAEISAFNLQEFQESETTD